MPDIITPSNPARIPVNLRALVVTPTVESVCASCTRARRFIESRYLWLAGPPELCDARDAWVEHRDQLRQMLARAWERCSVQA